MFLVLLGGVAPAIFLAGLGQAFRPRSDEPGRYQDWAGFLAVTWGLLLAALLAGFRIAGEGASLLALLLLPSLCALLAEGFLFLAEGRRAIFRRDTRRQLRGPAAIFLFDLLLLGALLSDWGDAFIGQVVLLGGFTLALAWLIWNRGMIGLILLSCAQMALLVYSLWATDSHRRMFASPDWLVNLENGLVYLIPGLAVFALARILGWALQGASSLSRRKLLLAGALAIPILLLIAGQAATASGWDVATDGLGGVLVLGLNTVVGIAAATMLAWRLPAPRRSPVFIFAMLIPVIISAANQFGTFGFDGAWGNLPRARTHRRAEVVNQAILRYHERRGKYPQELSELTPSYLLYLPTPFMIPGQDWCYQEEGETYHLGYVYRDFFSSAATVKIHAAEGEAPALDWVCEAEAAKYQRP